MITTPRGGVSSSSARSFCRWGFGSGSGKSSRGRWPSCSRSRFLIHSMMNASSKEYLPGSTKGSMQSRHHGFLPPPALALQGPDCPLKTCNNVSYLGQHTHCVGRTPRGDVSTARGLLGMRLEIRQHVGQGPLGERLLERGRDQGTEV